MDYQIIRPPLAESFELPSQEDLLNLKVGDHAKIMFKVGDDAVERMWVIISEQQDMAEWTGVLDNDPIGEETQQALQAGMKVKFHPLDIVQTRN